MLPTSGSCIFPVLWMSPTQAQRKNLWQLEDAEGPGSALHYNLHVVDWSMLCRSECSLHLPFSSICHPNPLFKADPHSKSEVLLICSLPPVCKKVWVLWGVSTHFYGYHFHFCILHPPSPSPSTASWDTSQVLGDCRTSQKAHTRAMGSWLWLLRNSQPAPVFKMAMTGTHSSKKTWLWDVKAEPKVSIWLLCQQLQPIEKVSSYRKWKKANKLYFLYFPTFSFH